MKIFLLDNYDSFTYNLVHYLEGFDCKVDVFRNDEIPFDTISSYNKIVLSPGPGLPSEAAGMMRVIELFHNQIPMLGVCLGFQAMIEFYGGTIYNQKEVKHGVAESCIVDNTSKLFRNLHETFRVGLYHSWAASESEMPEVLHITARTENNVIMAFEHQSLPVCGVQFHPESILTENGKEIVQNFILNF